MLYTMTVQQDFLGMFTGEIEEFPDFAAEADDMEELMAGVQAAVEAWAAENGIDALPAPVEREPDFSDPKRIPLLVEVDDGFLRPHGD